MYIFFSHKINKKNYRICKNNFKKSLQYVHVEKKLKI